MDNYKVSWPKTNAKGPKEMEMQLLDRAISWSATAQGPS